MTADFWISTAQTVVFLCVTGWAWWVVCRIAELLNNAEIIRAHSEGGAQYANRAALDARQMLDVLTEHWQRMRDEQPEIIEVVDQRTDDVPPTEPQPVVVPTEPMSRAWDNAAAELAHGHTVIRGEDEGRVHDQAFAEILAHADAYIRDMGKAPVAKPARKRAPRKATT